MLMMPGYEVEVMSFDKNCKIHYFTYMLHVAELFFIDVVFYFKANWTSM